MEVLIFISIEVILFILLYYVCKQLSDYVDPQESLCKQYKDFIKGTFGE